MKSFWDYQKENNSKSEDSLDSIDKKKEKTEEKQQKILNKVSAFSVETILHKVAWVLNRYPQSRDSDITLLLKFWEEFEPEYNRTAINPDDLYKFTRLTTLTRARAKLQNEYKLFLASPDVRGKRGTLSEEEKQKLIESKPIYPITTVFMDDSGKNADFLIVGSVWFIADYQDVYRAVRQIRKEANFIKEFHFKELNRDELPIYKAVIDVFREYANNVSFKLITIPRSGLKKSNNMFSDLYYHLIIKGIEHDNQTGRAPLPRKLQVWIDSQEAGLDRMMVANLDDRLKLASTSRFDSKLLIDSIYVVDSKKSFIVQIADLFTGSVNRIHNRSGTTNNHKDELAEYFLSTLEIDFGLPENDKIDDFSVHIAL